MDYKKEYLRWTTEEIFDEETKKELLGITDDKEIEDRFYKELEFGTAGLRGIIGAGTNRMNEYTVGKATQGLANYILKQCDSNGLYKGEIPSIAISFDSRHKSREFANLVARIMVANNIRAYIYEDLRPTPQLSFTVRYLNCISGVNITASHNPSDYNGYKVYWEDGAQITDPHDEGITNEVKKIIDYNMIKKIGEEETANNDLFVVIGKKEDDAYIEAVKKQLINGDIVKKMSNDLKIVYTPLHGTGNIPVRRVLGEIGLNNVYVVKEQELPNGDFPTCPYPNPEISQPFELGLKLAAEVDADLILATDPDADRLGVYVKDNNGEYHALTGNMSGCMLAYYEIEQHKLKDKLPADSYIIETVVTSKMAKAAADKFGVKTEECLTGFKNICRVIYNKEQEGVGTYIFGFEESYGCLIGTHCRDKDAVVTTMAICEMAAYYKEKEMSLWEALLSMYEDIGYFKESTLPITLSGIDGAEKILKIMEDLRKNPPFEFGSYNVTKVRDYKLNTILDVKTNKVNSANLPSSNVLYFELEDDAWLCVRPSGTEPKIKFYIGVKGSSLEDADTKCANMEIILKEFVDKVTK